MSEKPNHASSQKVAGCRGWGAEVGHLHTRACGGDNEPTEGGWLSLHSSGEGKWAWNRTVDRLQAAISGRFDNTHKERVRAR